VNCRCREGNRPYLPCIDALDRDALVVTPFGLYMLTLPGDCGVTGT
jgi:hypothetical protein